MAKKAGEKFQLILQSAKEVFAEEGYRASTISKIADRAGIGDGTIYIYFKNKEDILTTLFHETIYNQFVPQAEQAISYFNDASMLLYELTYTHFEYFGSDFHLAKVIQIESRQSDPNIRESMKQGIVRYFRLIESIVEKGQEQGVFRKDISPRNARKLIFGTLDEMVTCWTLSKKQYPLLNMVEPAYKMFSQTLANIPPPYLSNMPSTIF